MNETKMNSKEAVAICRKGFSLSFSDDLTSIDNSVMPEKLSNLSRFSLFASDARKGGTRYFKANIPQADIKGIHEKVLAALTAKTHWEISNTPTTENTEAATVQDLGPLEKFKAIFRFGNLKNQTVGYVVATGNKAELKSQIEALEKNSAKYPANKALLDEILEAQKVLAENPQLAVETAAVPKATSTDIPIVLYKEDVKPLISTEKDGKCLVYSISLICHIGRNFPWEINIANMQSPVIKDSKGKLQIAPQQGDKEKTEKTSILCSDKEFLGLINRLNELVDSFVKETTPTLRKQANELANAWRTNKT